jgi:hypothetical protein
MREIGPDDPAFQAWLDCLRRRRLEAARKPPTNHKEAADDAGHGHPPYRSLFVVWQCRIQGANAFWARQPIVACPYGDDREFSGRALRDGWREAAQAAGVKLPHQVAALP